MYLGESKIMSLSVSFYIKNKALFIRLVGEMDQECVGDLKDKLYDIIVKNDIKNIVFNLKYLDFIDSTGIGIIIGRYNQIRMRQGYIILCSINRAIERVILLSGLTRICIIKTNEEESNHFLEVVYG